MKLYTLTRLICCAAVVLCGCAAFAWGPRAQLSIVNMAQHLVSREQNIPLTRRQSEIRDGASISVVELEELHPDVRTDPLLAVESEIALLSAAKGTRLDAYFAWRLGALGKMVSRITAPMATADPDLRAQYYNDADQAIDSGSLSPTPRKTIDAMSQLERTIREAGSADELIESEYASGVGFRGAAATRLAGDASRSVNTVADVWWTIIASRAVPGNVSDEQLRRYVLRAYSFYIERGNMGEIEAADQHYADLVAFTPDMRARIGDMLYEAGFRERAVKEYEAVLAATPDRRDVVEKLGNYYVERAEDALEKNLLEEALAGFGKALEANALHPTAEQRRIEVAAMIRVRDELHEQYQMTLRQAENLGDLAEEEAARAHYAEAIALLQQSAATLREVGDEFPLEAQRRTRSLRDISHRINELNQALLNNAMVLSGAGFGPDLHMLLEENARGLEQEALDVLLQQTWQEEIRRLSTQLQPLQTIQ